MEKLSTLKVAAKKKPDIEPLVESWGRKLTSFKEQLHQLREANLEISGTEDQTEIADLLSKGSMLLKESSDHGAAFRVAMEKIA